MDKIRIEEIRSRLNMQPAAQAANKNKIRWWSHVKRMASTAPSKALVIHPVGKRPRGRLRNRWEDDVPKWYKEMGIPMTDVNNWVKDRRPIVNPHDADGIRVRLIPLRPDNFASELWQFRLPRLASVFRKRH